MYGPPEFGYHLPLYITSILELKNGFNEKILISNDESLRLTAKEVNEILLLNLFEFKDRNILLVTFDPSWLLFLDVIKLLLESYGYNRVNVGYINKRSIIKKRISNRLKKLCNNMSILIIFNPVTRSKYDRQLVNLLINNLNVNNSSKKVYYLSLINMLGSGKIGGKVLERYLVEKGRIKGYLRDIKKVLRHQSMVQSLLNVFKYDIIEVEKDIYRCYLCDRKLKKFPYNKIFNITDDIDRDKYKIPELKNKKFKVCYYCNRLYLKPEYKKLLAKNGIL